MDPVSGWTAESDANTCVFSPALTLAVVLHVEYPDFETWMVCEPLTTLLNVHGVIWEFDPSRIAVALTAMRSPRYSRSSGPVSFVRSRRWSGPGRGCPSNTGSIPGTPRG